MSGRTYLDYNATAPTRAEAREAVSEALNLHGNPSSVHEEGRQVRALVENAREKVAALVGADPKDVIFTSGGTEANVTALSPLNVNRDAPESVVCFMSQIEHPSVLASGRFAPDAIRLIGATSDGIIDVTELERQLRILVPNTQIKASSINGKIILSGLAMDAPSVAKAVSIARQFAPETAVTNAIGVNSSQQVLLLQDCTCPYTPMPDLPLSYQ